MRRLAESEQPDALSAIDLQSINGARRCRAWSGSGNGGVEELEQCFPARAGRGSGVCANSKVQGS